MNRVYVSRSKFRIFSRKPSYGVWTNGTEGARMFNFTTNNPRYLTGIVAKKGYKLVYSND